MCNSAAGECAHVRRGLESKGAAGNNPLLHGGGSILTDFLSICLFTKSLLRYVVHTKPFSLLLLCTTRK